MDTLKPLSINLHITERCNMKCRVCFAKYGRRACDYRDWIAILNVIAEETSGRYTSKVSFAGGEPTLVPYLPSLVRHAKAIGCTTSIITNGTGLTEKYLVEFDGCLDWVGISIDSVCPATNKALGRTVRGRPLTCDTYLAAARSVHRTGLKLKINTVVSKPNAHEDLVDFMSQVKPDRWKIMQATRIDGQNDKAEFDEVDSVAFRAYADRHQGVLIVIAEKTEDMLGSYIMIDPSGAPYGNAQGSLLWGRPILQSGLLGQLDALGYDYTATEARGGFR